MSNNRKLTVTFVAAYERVTNALNVTEFLANHQINFPEEFTLSAHLHRRAVVNRTGLAASARGSTRQKDCSGAQAFGAVVNRAACSWEYTSNGLLGI